ncbi:MAG: cytidylate kinase-like family protein [Lachnospiraceae bacterium]|nr:cytidylate kinase-like family protein [Lachnospiraceae bacterium]
MDNKTVITIARSYGSGGRTLGKKLAGELGIPCYDREILRMASDESGISEALFGEADETMRFMPLFRNAKDAHTGEVFPPDSDNFTSSENLFRYQAKVIKRLAETESCIIIGRCADYVLKDYDQAVRLFFYASEENCIRRVVDQQGVNERDAKDHIAKIDKYRANYYKFFTGHNWYDAHNYDFCIDTSSMSYEKLIRVVRAYLTERE